MVPTFTLLALAVISLWLGSGNTNTASSAARLRANAWLLVWAASLVSALATGVVEPSGLVAIGALAAVVIWFSRAPASGWQPALAAGVLLVIAAVFTMHRVPGIHNARVIPGVRFSSDAIPFTLHLNYDKTLVGLFLLGWCHGRISRWSDWRTMLRATAPWAAVLIVLLMLPALTAGYVQYDPKFPRESWLWMGGNLLFTCVAEEALFRGFVQAGLQRWWKGVAHGQWFALVAAAALFGIAHAAGGVVYVLLSTIAGLGYGWIYQRTRRIEASVLTHFAVNATHFFFFTYPALARA